MFVYCTVQFRGILDFSSLDLIPVNCVLFIRNSLYVHVLLIIKENCFENFSCSALSRTALNILPDSFGQKRTLFFSVQTSLESCNIKVFKVFRAIQYRPEKLADTNTQSSKQFQKCQTLPKNRLHYAVTLDLKPKNSPHVGKKVYVKQASILLVSQKWMGPIRQLGQLTNLVTNSEVS